MKIGKISALIAILALVSVQLLAQKSADLTLELSKDSEVALVYVEILPAVPVREHGALQINEETAFTIKRGRERAFSLEAGKSYTILAVRKWEDKEYRFTRNITLPEAGTRVLIEPKAN